MKRQPIRVLQPIQKKYEYESVLWTLCPAVCLTAGCLLAWMQLWGIPAQQVVLIGTAAAVGILTALLSDLLEKKHRIRHFLWVIPWPVVLVYAGLHHGGTGIFAAINVLIARWNEVKEAGVQLFRIAEEVDSIAAVITVLALLQGQLSWFLARGRKMAGMDINGLLWILLMLVEYRFYALSAALLLAGILSTRMSEQKMMISRPGKCWTLCLVAGLCAMAFLIPGDTSGQIKEIRYQTVQGIRHLRYGKDILPDGDLNLAGTLLDHEEEVLKVQSGQEKSLYLKGFVGARLQDGHWKPLASAAYGGTNTGMLEWLRTEEFDPLTQTARYYQLGKEEDRPEENWLDIRTTGGSRSYVYAPASLEQVNRGSKKEVRDLRLKSTGPVGEWHYELQELSGSRPAELMIADNWVYAPETEEQRQYIDAEAVYRKFVYEQYTEVDEEQDELMQKWFWSDYDSENDGIYSALTHIRDRLSAEITYTEHLDPVPEGKEALRWFLTESRSGNAVLYASAAVEAFRAHGIPARYVEGYYIPSTQFAEAAGTSISVSGTSAHAWVEVYFDGIGWLPLEVTPGYYYSIVELQQMIGSPDSLHKTAAIDDNTFGMDAVAESGSQTTVQIPQPVKVIWNMALIFLGVAVLLLITVTFLFAVGELARVLFVKLDQKYYWSATQQERIRVIEENIYLVLEILGIKASLGWNTEEVDKLVVQAAGTVAPGDYTRACMLMEKAVYGGTELEPYDERVLIGFRGKLYRAGISSDLRTRLKFRYFGLYRIWRKIRK